MSGRVHKSLLVLFGRASLFASPRAPEAAFAETHLPMRLNAIHVGAFQLRVGPLHAACTLRQGSRRRGGGSHRIVDRTEPKEEGLASRVTSSWLLLTARFA